MTDYCTRKNVIIYLDLPDAKGDPLIDDLITAVSRAFDIATGYTFGATVDTARTYYVFEGDTDANVLLFDQPFASITSIVNGNGNMLASSDYLLRPRDVPYRRAELMPNSTESWQDGSDYDGIIVTGKVGYPITSDITQACSLWTAFMYRQKDNPLIDITAIEAGAVITTPNRPRYTSDTINLYKDRRPSG